MKLRLKIEKTVELDLDERANEGALDELRVILDRDCGAGTYGKDSNESDIVGAIQEMYENDPEGLIEVDVNDLKVEILEGSIVISQDDGAEE